MDNAGKQTVGVAPDEGIEQEPNGEKLQIQFCSLLEGLPAIGKDNEERRRIGSNTTGKERALRAFITEAVTEVWFVACLSLQLRQALPQKFCAADDGSLPPVHVGGGWRRTTPVELVERPFKLIVHQEAETGGPDLLGGRPVGEAGPGIQNLPSFSHFAVFDQHLLFNRKMTMVDEEEPPHGQDFISELETEITVFGNCLVRWKGGDAPDSQQFVQGVADLGRP